MRTILYPPILDWGFLFQRPQQLMKQFAKSGWKVIFCNWTQIPNKEMEEIIPNLFICHDWESLKKQKNFEVDVFFTSYAYYNDKPIKSKITVYDCLDDFEEWEQYEEKMLQNSDLVFTTADFLFEKQKNRHNNIVMCKNACDFNMVQGNKVIPDDIKDIKKPIVAFVGAIASWIDSDLLQLIADKYNLVMIGVECENKTCPKNAIYLSRKNYKDLVHYYNYFDVGIIPFLINKTTIAANPIKMFEYMAGGMQVVATDLPECKGYDGVVYTSKNYEEFLNNIDIALANKEKNRQQAIKYAKENTWQSRFFIMEKAINKLLK